MDIIVGNRGLTLRITYDIDKNIYIGRFQNINIFSDIYGDTIDEVVEEYNNIADEYYGKLID